VAAMAHALGLRHVRAANRNRLEKAMDLARSVSSGGSAASASSH
jgi:hypothetical protein